MIHSTSLVVLDVPRATLRTSCTRTTRQTLRGAASVCSRGKRGSRLVFLTPPITVKKWAKNCEVRWTPAEMPFKYKEAPILVSNNGRSDFPSVKQFGCQLAAGRLRGISQARFAPEQGRWSRSWHMRWSRSTRGAAKAPPSAIATTYDEALPWKPPKVDRSRKATYRFFIAQRQGETADAESVLGTEGAGPGIQSQSRCRRSRQRKSCCRASRYT